MRTNRSEPRPKVAFDETDLARIRWCLSVTGQNYGEFIRTATMQAVDEIESEGRELMTRRRLELIRETIEVRMATGARVTRVWNQTRER